MIPHRGEGSLSRGEAGPGRNGDKVSVVGAGQARAMPAMHARFQRDLSPDGTECRLMLRGDPPAVDRDEAC